MSIGIIDSEVFTDIAEAIRDLNGEETKYHPSEMPDAIRALNVCSEKTLRALFLDDGTLEFNYLTRVKSTLGRTIESSYDIETTGYPQTAERPYYDIRQQVLKVVIDESVASAQVESCQSWFESFDAMTEIHGMEYLSGITNSNSMFAFCTELESIYATDFDNTCITNSSNMFYTSPRIVGGTDGATPRFTSTADIAYVGAGGVFTDPNNDTRQWIKTYAYEDGTAEFTIQADPDTTRDLLAQGRICSNANYSDSGFLFDSSVLRQMTSIDLADDLAALNGINTNYWFAECNTVKAVTGFRNLHDVHSMRYTFSMCGITELDLRGFDPSNITDTTYLFSNCQSLTTIYADADWIPPTPSSDSGTFYGCRVLVGGAGTAFSDDTSKNTSEYFRIDTLETPGYLTAG